MAGRKVPTGFMRLPKRRCEITVYSAANYQVRHLSQWDTFCYLKETNTEQIGNRSQLAQQFLLVWWHNLQTLDYFTGEKNALNFQEWRDSEKNQSNGLGCALLHCTIQVIRNTERITKKPKHKPEASSMWKGCYRTFRPKPAVPCPSGINNTPTKTFYTATLLLDSYCHADLIYLSLGGENAGRASNILNRAPLKKH